MNILLIFTILAGTSLNYQTLKKQMVEEQIVARGIEDTLVLKAMLHVERHKFVPEKYKKLAYTDRPLPIGYEQTISQPYIVALMTSLLNLSGNEKVLEIGTGSGYQAAILAEIVSKVYTIEILKPLAESAEVRLNGMGYKNIYVKCGDGYKGWPEYAPFDAIIVTCAPEQIPQPLIEQLKIGGKMVIPVGKLYQELILITRTEDGIKKEPIIPVRFVPMQREAQQE
ncbi:MAG: protein-L-isoaspartate(D-aspartate) O-methyltransferase [bacterium]|nr:protein-L-isoaspartate(D-aspartate) O-methyltransferase [bacterium]